MDPYLELLLILPRHERYLVLLPPDLLTRPELVIALRAHVRRQAHLAQWEELLMEEARRRGIAVGTPQTGPGSTADRWPRGLPSAICRAPVISAESRKKSGPAGVTPGDALP